MPQITPIQLRASTTTGNKPVSLLTGELAINAVDGMLYWADGSAAIHGTPLLNVLTALSPVMTGTPTAPTAPAGSADLTVANTAWTTASIQAALANISSKPSVTVATTSNLASLSGLQTIDNIQLVDGARVLVRLQTDATTNGIYIAHTGAWARAPDLLVPNQFVGAFVFVESGANLADTAWIIQNTAAPVIGTTPIVWGQFGLVTTVINGPGIGKSGNTISVLGWSSLSEGNLLKFSGGALVPAIANTDYVVPTPSYDAGTF